MCGDSPELFSCIFVAYRILNVTGLLQRRGAAHGDFNHMVTGGSHITLLPGNYIFVTNKTQQWAVDE